MIGYCPIDFDDSEPEQKPPTKSKIITKKESVVGEESTECNYVVMFFIVGVIALATMDAVGK